MCSVASVCCGRERCECVRLIAWEKNSFVPGHTRHARPPTLRDRAPITNSTPQGPARVSDGAQAPHWWFFISSSISARIAGSDSSTSAIVCSLRPCGAARAATLGVCGRLLVRAWAKRHQTNERGGAGRRGDENGVGEAGNGAGRG